MRKLLASTAICGLLLAGCVPTPTQTPTSPSEATSARTRATTATAAPNTCEGTCRTTKTASTLTDSAASTAATPAAAASPTYSRDQFGSGWADPDGNGCDGRQDAIARATTDQHRTSRCYVAVGDVTDWYTGKVCNDCATRSFDVDHVVALADAWRSGADKWTRAKRVAYANDPLVLVVTGASLNRSKSDKGPDEWAPIDHAHACQYVRRYERIKRVWRLHTTRAQRGAIRRTLASC
jgi:hypothetical protein